MDKKITVGINGFGRIGRNLFRLLLNHPSMKVVAVNDLADTKTMSHLLKYDSIHGFLNENISYSENEIIVAGKRVRFSSEKKIEDLRWGNVDVVVESTGKFKTRKQLENHLNNGDRKSTRLNSSHVKISYAVFCLKKKNHINQ